MATNPMDAALAKIPLLAGLSKKEIRHVSSLATAIRLRPGHRTHPPGRSRA